MNVIRNPLLRSLSIVFCLNLLVFSGVDARESKQKRKENALAVRQMIWSAYRIPILYELNTPEFKSELQRTINYLRASLAKISKKLDAPSLQSIATEITAIEAISNSPQRQVSLLRERCTDFSAKQKQTFAISTAPAQTPLWDLGRETFVANCAVCHGLNGDPKTALVSKLSKRPLSYLETPLRESLAPFDIYNLLITGLPLSDVKHGFDDKLDDHELWSTSFYIMTMLHAKSTTGDKVSGITLSQLASFNDQMLGAWMLRAYPSTSDKERQSQLSLLRWTRSFDPQVGR